MIIVLPFLLVTLYFLGAIRREYFWFNYLIFWLGIVIFTTIVAKLIWLFTIAFPILLILGIIATVEIDEV